MNNDGQSSCFNWVNCDNTSGKPKILFMELTANNQFEKIDISDQIDD